VLGGACLLAGYTWAWGSGMQRAVTPELMRFHRREQLQRLIGLVSGKPGAGRWSLAARRDDPR
jgi:hypothetical protein